MAGEPKAAERASSYESAALDALTSATLKRDLALTRDGGAPDGPFIQPPNTRNEWLEEARLSFAESRAWSALATAARLEEVEARLSEVGGVLEGR